MTLLIWAVIDQYPNFPVLAQVQPWQSIHQSEGSPFMLLYLKSGFLWVFDCMFTLSKKRKCLVFSKKKACWGSNLYNSHTRYFFNLNSKLVGVGTLSVFSCWKCILLIFQKRFLSLGPGIKNYIYSRWTLVQMKHWAGFYHKNHKINIKYMQSAFLHFRGGHTKAISPFLNA